MKINEKLTSLQVTMHVPKGQQNKFGGYSYRSCEDILEAVKPKLTENGLTLMLTDSIEQVGERIYVCATARLTDGEQEITNKGYAREPLSRKGMDESQITGAASSYARKYALAGLFLLDDNKDADSMAAPEPQKPKATEQYATEYSQEDFDKNFPAWEKLIESGQQTADSIYDRIVKKGLVLSSAMTKQLKAVKKINVQGE